MGVIVLEIIFLRLVLYLCILVFYLLACLYFPWGIRSQRWLGATMWLLGMELKTSERAASWTDFLRKHSVCGIVISRKSITSLFFTLIHYSLIGEVFRFHECESILMLTVLLIPHFYMWGSGRMHGAVSVFLYLLGLALCLSKRSVLENILWCACFGVFTREDCWGICLSQ